MKKAIIIYQSKTGTTKKYAQEIGAYLQERQIATFCLPVEKYREGMLQDADYILLGCWTKGLLVVFQKPDNDWRYFAQKTTVPQSAKVALFATYKIRTGSMFKNMARCVNHTGSFSVPNMKSKDGKLSGKDKVTIDEFIHN
ncbi:MAG: flavodoxin domain-containing protein [Bacteroidales bacterium]|nr:flavodoxin domain-containing protein [Bacteroidales bacterium]